MYRSFTDRVFGGVCGGLGTSLHIDSWLLRLAVVVLAVLSAGLVAVLYVLLWWVMPQESLVTSGRGGFFRGLIILALILLTAAGWAGRNMGWLQTADGKDLVLPGVLVVTSAIFLLRQVRG